MQSMLADVLLVLFLVVCQMSHVFLPYSIHFGKSVKRSARKVHPGCIQHTHTHTHDSLLGTAVLTLDSCCT